MHVAIPEPSHQRKARAIENSRVVRNMHAVASSDRRYALPGDNERAVPDRLIPGLDVDRAANECNGTRFIRHSNGAPLVSATAGGCSAGVAFFAGAIAHHRELP